MAEGAHKSVEHERKVQVKRAAQAQAVVADDVAPLLDADSAPVMAAGDPGETMQRYAAVLRDPRLREGAGSQRFRLVRQLQRGHGNGQVERVLAQVRRQPTSSVHQETPSEVKGTTSSTTTDNSFDIWLKGKIYDLVNKELGDDQLRLRAKEIAAQAIDLLMSQVNEFSNNADLLDKARYQLIGELLTNDLQDAVVGLLSGPYALRLRKTFLRKLRTEPNTSVGAILLGLTAGYIANADLSKLEERLKLSNKFSVQGGADFGKIRDLTNRQLRLSLEYTYKQFKASAGGIYVGEGDQKGIGGQAGLTFNPKTYTFKTEARLLGGERLGLQINPSLDLGNFGATGTFSYDSSNRWSGSGKLRIGRGDEQLSTDISLNSDHRLDFGFGGQLRLGPLDLSGRAGIKANAKDGMNNISVGEVTCLATLRYQLMGDPAKPRKPFLLIKAEGKLLFPSNETSDTPQPKDNQALFESFMLLEGNF